MKKALWILGPLAGVAAGYAILAGRPRPAEAAAPDGLAIGRADVQVWASFEGMLDSRQVVDVMCRINGGAVTELIPEGAAVRKGDVLVRFDSSTVERDLVRIQRDFELAKAELEGLERAKIPMEIRDLELQAAQAEADLQAEDQFLADSRELLKDGLVAEAEVRKQEQAVASLRMKKENLGHQLQVTRAYLHPSQLARARATLASAEREWMVATQILDHCTMLAPGDGVVVYRPQWVNSEMRTVRVGDVLARNQVFLSLPDMTNLIVHLDVPEGDVARVAHGQRVEVIPKAFPDLRLRGTVESVGSMAQMLGDRRSWQKTFHVVIGLHETDARLRTGMSVLCKVLTVEAPGAVVIPRTAVRWDGDRPYCVGADGRRRDLELGAADEDRFIVERGLVPGDRVRPL